jgi:hypothetical protein
MLKRSIAVLAVALSLGCASTSMKQLETGSGTGSSAHTVSLPSTNYVLLSSPTLLYSLDDDESRRGHFYGLGTLTNNGFIPKGKVEGSGRFCADGKDWLSLADQKVHSAAEGAPVAPYLLGCIQGSAFAPASRDIVSKM